MTRQIAGRNRLARTVSPSEWQATVVPSLHRRACSGAKWWDFRRMPRLAYAGFDAVLEHQQHSPQSQLFQMQVDAAAADASQHQVMQPDPDIPQHQGDAHQQEPKDWFT